MGGYLLAAILSALMAWGVVTIFRHFGVEVPFLVAFIASPFIMAFLFVSLALILGSACGVSVYLEEKLKKWKGK